MTALNEFSSTRFDALRSAGQLDTTRLLEDCIRAAWVQGMPAGREATQAAD